MYTYKIIFHRYAINGSRFSSPIFKSFESFDAAVQYANTIIIGLVAADQVNRYIIASIEHSDLRGNQCDGGLLFETDNEFQARMATGK